MGRYGDIDYPTVTRRGFALGIVLLVVGILGHVFGPLLFGPLPEWELTLFTDLEIAGVLIGLLTPIVFGIILPLTE